jgi:hypothetical protein
MPCRHRLNSGKRRAVFITAAACAASLIGASATPAADAVDFNRDIRPILAEHCWSCHGQDARKRAADLRLDDRAVAIASGAVAPGDLPASGLVQRIRSSDAEFVMPPPTTHRDLSERQKQILERWIQQGAAYAVHWAFVPPQRPTLPAVRNERWPRNDLDRFVLAKLEEGGMTPSGEADRGTLLRRVSLDLIGLPPTPDEIDAFVADTSTDAYEKTVDRLLASPHYGEWIAIEWLDAARYADSNGFQEDGDTWQWLWRDWVVRALNEDMPFDRFSVEQLAGDLLPNATVEQRLATAFNRNHVLNGEGGAIPEEQRFNNLFDRVDTFSTTWLGLTVACAQCHDHKFDPVTQGDYYAILDAFNRVPERGVPEKFSKRIFVAPPVLELPPAETANARLAAQQAKQSAEAAAKPLVDAAFAAWRDCLFAGEESRGVDGVPLGVRELLAKPSADRSLKEIAEAEKQLRKSFDELVKERVVANCPTVKRFEVARQAFEAVDGDGMPRVMVMSDDKPRETRILERGEYLAPQGEPITCRAPAFLPQLAPGEPRNRLGLARWLFRSDHPLTARVQVNRMWQRFYGTGLVRTPEDLGVQSEYPLHRELLDWLAVEFRARGWSQKAMHRLLVTSSTYRQASGAVESVWTADPENRLFGRATRFRLPAPVLRDVALAVGGLLDDRLGGAPVYPYQPEAVWESLAVTQQRDFTYPASHGRDLYRRSLYTFWRRTVAPVNMFDTSSRQTCTVRPVRTSTPLHSLTTLNDPTWVESARALAERALLAADEPTERLTLAFRRVVGRQPTVTEAATLRRMYDEQIEAFADDVESAVRFLGVGESRRDESLRVAEHAALTGVCLAMLNLDEALTRE